MLRSIGMIIILHTRVLLLLMMNRPPGDICAEFEVEQVSIPAGAEYIVSAQPCASVIIVVKGDCTLNDGQKECGVGLGSVLFVPANVSVKATTTSSACECYRAHVNMQNV